MSCCITPEGIAPSHLVIKRLPSGAATSMVCNTIIASQRKWSCGSDGDGTGEGSRDSSVAEEEDAMQWYEYAPGRGKVRVCDGMDSRSGHIVGIC